MSPSLGQRLQQMREQRGLSLPDVAHRTRIPVQRLRELEEDNYNALGSVTYAKGHLKAYADLLGVEADEVLEQLKTPPLGGVRNYRYLVESYGSLKAVSQSEHPVQDRTTVASNKSPMITATVSAFCVLLVGGVLLGNAFLAQQEPQPTPAAGAIVTNPTVIEEPTGKEEPEFSLYGANLEVEAAEEVRAASPSSVTPPKALPVTDEVTSSRRKVSEVPKAQLVE
ncbi:helix-turn-helix protein [Roseimicrobium gellanilyticum]|uniref:Helix-turn-helix protein n=1 Tax=Roseimicrobium gellanilyticum TaxID=748857 RepID=A0A366HU79_9BACT|nr:helix-turn-helix transcriptional regulator [Roseimicrobium gellanilyticum]RBP47390.1 helix-turn-helix protein [Roseimicrobium gellanilyticum]